MAIQIPNPGTGNGASGDNEFVLWTKTKDNFSNTTHAASRLVGTDTGNIPEMGSRGIANSGLLARSTLTLSSDEANKPSLAKPSGFYKNASAAGGDMSIAIRSSIVLQAPYVDNSNNPFAVQLIIPVASPYGLFIRRKDPLSDTYLTATELFYSNLNTTKDSNGMIKASSPVLRVFSSHIEGNEDGEKMGATFIKNSVGNYLLRGTTGLANEGWYVTVPQDANGNNLVAVEYESLENGDVVLRTYKRKFDFETVSIVADHDNPLDIPDTRWVDLRFNEIPVEPSEPESEV